MPLLIWLDLETTGLDPDTDRILEIGVRIADFNLPLKIIREAHAVLSPFTSLEDYKKELDPVVFEMHTKNGLLDECLELYPSPSLEQVQNDLLREIPFVSDYRERPILAGSSVHFDAGFLKAWLPEVHKRLSHRHYDVTALKLFCQSMGMQKLRSFGRHRAIPDILESMGHAAECARWLWLHGDKYFERIAAEGGLTAEVKGPPLYQVAAGTSHCLCCHRELERRHSWEDCARILSIDQEAAIRADREWAIDMAVELSSLEAAAAPLLEAYEVNEPPSAKDWEAFHAAFKRSTSL